MARFSHSLLAAVSLALYASAAAAQLKPRVVVTADPELDDSNSLVRYLLFSTDFRAEGLIYASSGFHWKGDGTGKKWFVGNREYTRFGLNPCPCESWRWAPNERFIDDAVETYAQVYPNLRVHNASYPTPAELKSIQEQYARTPQWAAIHQKVSRKAILSPSGDQDDTYANYIRPNWPDIRTLPAGAGGVALTYGAGTAASAENAVYYGAAWTRENVSSRGPLGAFYRVWGDGKQMVKNDIFDFFGLSGYTVPQLRAMGYIVWTPPRPKGEFVGEGDTFTYLNLVDNDCWGIRTAHQAAGRDAA